MSMAIAIGAGGTGGHLFPAQALARELVARGHRVTLLTDARGAAYDAPSGAIDILTVRSATPSGRGVFGKLGAGMAIAAGCLQARRMLRRLGAEIVVGFGGYPSLPTVLAAPGMGARVVLHEQNAVLGRVNRLLLPKADAVALSFELASPPSGRPELKPVVTGNPVRAEVLAACGVPYAAAGPEGVFRLLVFGGSQGARLSGDVVPRAIGQLSSEFKARLEITQQCRSEDGDAVRAAYRELGLKADVREFFPELPELLGNTHLVIARSGAGTVSELAAVGRPALLTPYAFAMDDHQTANAKALSNGGGAVLLPEDRFSAEELGARLESLARRPDVLSRMAQRAAEVGRPDAVARLADRVLDWANGNRGGGVASGRRAAA